MRGEKVIIIGSGFSSLSAACYLAKEGYDVEIFEKNNQVGGRARTLVHEGFTFDIGPTFYWMPDVFESFFNDFGKKVSDYYKLERLNPSYEVYFGENDSITIADDLDKIKAKFESIEAGSGEQLQSFIDGAEINYNLAIKDLVYQPGENLLEIINPRTASKLGLLITTIQKQVRKKFKNPKLRQILEFPVLFLGAKPSNTPALYNFMNYADFKLGTWYAEGGMYSVVQAMQSLAESLGVQIKTNATVQKIITKDKKVTGVSIDNVVHRCDILLSGADYAHTESLLPKASRQYSENYWGKKTFAPSALLFYVGFNKKLKNLSHHTLFFDSDFDEHSKSIYDNKEWPSDPLFYASFPSMTDASTAPKGKEAAIFLIPLAIDLEDNAQIRSQFLSNIINRLEKNTNQELEKDIIFHKSYCINDFKKDYNSFGGNAYGLANTLFQTHILRPNLRSRKLKNMFFTGQLTVPGPGVPPSIISGKIVSTLIKKHS